MATILNKNLTRESTITVNDKNLMVIIKEDQSVELKLKGTRGGGLTINLLELWDYLGGEKDISSSSGGDRGMILTQKASPQKGNQKMISLYDLRSHNAISQLDYGTMAKFDEIISSVIKSEK